MCERRPPVATFRAGATTSARIAGPRSGTRIWRGLLAVSAARRRASVSRAPAGRARDGLRRLMGIASAMADMSDSFGVVVCASGRFAKRAGELQVDVVEVGRPRGDLERAEALGTDRCQNLGGRYLVQRHRHVGADGKRVLSGDPAAAQCRQGLLRIAGHAELENLAAQPFEQRLRRVQRYELAVVDYGHAIAQTARPLQVVP